MAKFSLESNRQIVRVLSDENILEINEKALEILEDTGVFFHTKEALEILRDNGADVNMETKIVKFKREMIINAVNNTPESFYLYDCYGKESVLVGDNKSHFDPGSSGIRFLESDGVTYRDSTGEDLVNIVRLTDTLEYIDLASSAITPYDIPKMIGDSYRVYVLLKNTRKPFVTGAFSAKGMMEMHSLLAAASGGAENLSKKPRAVFDVCSLSPLKWTEISCNNLIDGARLNMPMQSLSVPMVGASAPATLYGCVLMHTIETLSGLAFVNCINPGNPMIYGGAPMNFDMRYSNTSLNAVEGNLISSAYAQMGRYYGIPTHTYSGLSDAKTPDAQAGFESGVTAAIASLSGINVISGAGMLDFCNTFSLEKLVIDNEICGMINRLQKGIVCNKETLAVDLIKEYGSHGDYLSSEHTFEWFREESFMPSPVMDRKNLQEWLNDGSKSAFDHAKEIAVKNLAEYKSPEIPNNILADIESAWETIKRNNQ